MTHKKFDRSMGLVVRYFSSFSKGSKSCLLGLLLLTTSGLVFGVDQKSNSNPCNIGEKDAAGLNVDFSSDVHAGHEYAGTIARMLKQEKFEELDCLADQVRSAKERFPGGAWKIHELYAALYEPTQYPVKHATQEDWDNLLQHLQRWATARPKSVTVRVALARTYILYAFDARGERASHDC